MRSLWKHSLVLACSGLMFAAPLPSFAAQDTYVSIGPIVKGTSPLPRVDKVDVTVGNAGNVAPNAYMNAFLRVSIGSQQICNIGIPGINLPPGQSVKALRFQMTYPQLKPGVSPQQWLQTQGRELVMYTIEAEVSYNYPCSQFETNCGNNLQRAPREFRSGGTPSCVKLVQ